MSIEAIFISVFGIVACFLQAMLLFTLTDIKDRIVRLENKLFGTVWDNSTERRTNNV